MSTEETNLHPGFKINISREGHFEKIQNKELKVSTKSLKAIRLSLIILVSLMLAVALVVTIIFYSDEKLNGVYSKNQILCLWAFPIIIYSYFTWLYLTRNFYKIEITEQELIHYHMPKKDVFSHSEILAALRARPVTRNREGVWLPTLSSKKILLSENDTLPGKPFIEDILAFYGVEIPQDPYGTDRNTFFALGLVLVFLVSPVFIYLGYVNDNLNSLTYSIYITIFIDLVGFALLIISRKTTKCYKYNSSYGTNQEDNETIDDELFFDEEFLNSEDSDIETEDDSINNINNSPITMNVASIVSKINKNIRILVIGNNNVFYDGYKSDLHNEAPFLNYIVEDVNYGRDLVSISVVRK